MDIIKSQNPDEINVHRQVWGENTEATTNTKWQF